MIVPVRIKAGTKEIKTYVMLDSGATRPIINERTAKRLDTKWEARNAHLNTVGGSSYGKRKFTNVTIESLDGETRIELEDTVILNFLTTEDDTPPKNEEIREEEYMKGVEFDELEGEEVGMLISAKYAWTWLGGEIRRSTMEKPMGIKTKFGWALI